MESIYDLAWQKDYSYGDIRFQEEVEFSRYNFEEADVPTMWKLFELYEQECQRLIERGLFLPAYDYCLKCSHAFNLLDSRGAISVTQRVGLIGRVRKLAVAVARGYAKRREELGFPFLRQPAARGGGPMAKELLLEIGCEEIPAWMIPDALAWLATNLCQALDKHQLAAGEPWTSATPRRLTVCLPGVPESQPDREEEILGPAGLHRRRRGRGRSPRPPSDSPRKQGAAEDQLRVVETPKGAYVGFRKQIAGRPAADVLREALPPLIAGIPFPKTMYWREDKFRFVRPIRSILCLLGGAVVPFEVAGIASSDRTFGHRFLGRTDIPVQSLSGYRPGPGRQPRPGRRRRAGAEDRRGDGQPWRNRRA